MPTYNHIDLGDACRAVYLPGRIIKVYPQSDDVAPDLWDCADVYESENGVTYTSVPIFYHCNRSVQERESGAIEDGARGFFEDDDVILMCLLRSEPSEEKTPADKVFVIGHIGGFKRCAYNYVLVRISINELLPLEMPFGEYVLSEDGELEYTPFESGSHSNEYCIVFDVDNNTVPSIRKPDNVDEEYAFPCSVEVLKPFLDLCDLQGFDLWERGPQGELEVQVAGATVDWKLDFQGIDIGVGPMHRILIGYDEWFKPDECMQLFDDLRTAVMLDSEGAVAGDFHRAAMIWEDLGRSKVQGWKGLSRGVVFDSRQGCCLGGSYDGDGELSEAAAAAIQQLTNEINTISAVIDALNDEHAGLLSQLNEIGEGIGVAQGKLLVVEQAIIDFDPVFGGTFDLRALMARREQLNEEIRILGEIYERIAAEMSSIDEKIVVHNANIADRRERIRAILEAEVVPGTWGYARGVDNEILFYKSEHAQVGYGEDEIWVCAKNTWLGMVISYCDQFWKYQRFPGFPAVIPVDNIAAQRLAGTAVLQGMAGGGTAVADAAMATVADQTMSVTGGNNIFSVATLKMVHEAAYHRTTCPAIRPVGLYFGPGSFRVKQTPLPGRETEPQYESAINTRLERIDVWDRSDNWQNSIMYSAVSDPMANRAWWFKTLGQQWRFNMCLVDTPIGSMWGAAPHVQVGLWYVYQLGLSNGFSYARQNWPLHTHFISACKHSENVIVQIYITQRQGLTLWSQYSTPSQSFVIQHNGWGSYDCYYRNAVLPNPLAAPEGVTYPAPNDPVAYVKDGDSVIGHVSEVDDLAPYMSSRSYWHSSSVGTPNYLAASMNDVEILAAVDFYKDLKKDHGRYNPRDQERSPEFEVAIQSLIEHYYSESGAAETDLHYFYLDVEVL